jgi:hypothetical protein
MSTSKSKKIMKAGKIVGYLVPTSDGGHIVVRGGQGKEGYIGRIKPEKKR